MKDKILEAWEQEKAELTCEYNKISERLKELETELPPIQKQLSRVSMDVIRLKELANITGEKNPDDLKLAKKRAETLQNKHDSTVNQIELMKKRMADIERIKENKDRGRRVRTWILATAELWELRKQALDRQLTKEELETIWDNRKLVKNISVNEDRITGIIDQRGTFRDGMTDGEEV